jgi:hypothetical protein
MPSDISFPVLGALWVANLGFIIPLALACAFVVVAIPLRARRGRLSVPIYALMTLGAGLAAVVAGTFSGTRSVRGTTLGVVLSFIFFLFAATAVGSFLALLFYHRRPET